MICKAGKCIYFNLSLSTYSIEPFNAKMKVAILQQRQGWEPPQNNDLKLIIPEDYTFMASNNSFIVLEYPTTILKRVR